jgi:sucrose-6F-phosphate phosphohydrolase
VLLVTDLDNTLVGDDQALAVLNQKLLDQRDRLYLVYATGRSYKSAQELQRQKQLLEPDYWITGVGSQIYQNNQLWADWAGHISQDWHPEPIFALVHGFPQLLPQPIAEQNPWKLSFNLHPAAPALTIKQLCSAIDQEAIAAQVVFSSGEQVDILPSRAGKGKAVAYLQNILQISWGETLVCGDSGNDISLFEQPALGVIVANAQAELKAWWQSHRQPRHYLAEHSYAGGILEGLDWFKLLG